MSKNDRSWFWWALIPVISVVGALLYFRVLMPIEPRPGGIALFERGIDGPLLHWVNGYLGTFFNMRFLGNTIWLALPMLLFAGFRWHHLSRWQHGVWLFLVLAVLIIGGAGGFNYRYAMTLLPVLLAGVVLSMDERMRLAGIRERHRNAVFFLMVVATVVNTLLSIDLARRISRSDPVDRERMGDQGNYLNNLDSRPPELDHWLQEAGVQADDRVLVNNLPVYYYSTDRPGLYYWCGSDQYFGPKGEEPLFRTRTDEEVIAYLGDTLRTRFIFSDRNLSRYDLRFEQFLADRCDLLAEDDKGYTLHRLRGTFGK
jgi:hypothetical protein